MKLLLLTYSAGEGHNSCARAIKSYCDANGIDSVVLDVNDLINRTISHLLTNSYYLSITCGLFFVLYNISEIISNMTAPLSRHIKSPLYLACKVYACQLKKIINENNYDGIICTHTFPSEALTALRRRGELALPAINIVTDYTCWPFLPETEMDRYIIAHSDLAKMFTARHIPSEKLVPAGIPVNEAEFTKVVERSAARKIICGTEGIGPGCINGNWFLVMSGSMAYGALNSIIRELIEYCSKDDCIICVCGYNERVRRKLSGKFKDKGCVYTLGFTNRISVLMDACDVLISKPGGLTSTEAAVKNVPLVHSAAIPGLENYNRDFFHEHGMSYTEKKVKGQIKAAISLLNDDLSREKMLKAQRENVNPHASRDVVSLMKTLIDEQKNQNE